MLWSNVRCVFFIRCWLWIYLFDLDITERCSWGDAGSTKKIKEALKSKNMPRLGSFSPFQFPPIFFPTYCNRLNFKIHRKCWCKYKWSSTGERALWENVPLKNLWGTWRQWKQKNKHTNIYKIGVFSILSFEGERRSMELMIKGKFILLNSCPTNSASIT